MSTESVLKRTPLFESYKKLGAKVIDFGGWELPYSFQVFLKSMKPFEHKLDFLMSHIWVSLSLKEKMLKGLLIRLFQMT